MMAVPGRFTAFPGSGSCLPQPVNWGSQIPATLCGTGTLYLCRESDTFHPLLLLLGFPRNHSERRRLPSSSWETSEPWEALVPGLEGQPGHPPPSIVVMVCPNLRAKCSPKLSGTPAPAQVPCLEINTLDFPKIVSFTAVSVLPQLKTLVGSPCFACKRSGGGGRTQTPRWHCITL